MHKTAPSGTHRYSSVIDGLTQHRDADLCTCPLSLFYVPEGMGNSFKSGKEKCPLCYLQQAFCPSFSVSLSASAFGPEKMEGFCYLLHSIKSYLPSEAMNTKWLNPGCRQEGWEKHRCKGKHGLIFQKHQPIAGPFGFFLPIHSSKTLVMSFILFIFSLSFFFWGYNLESVCN